MDDHHKSIGDADGDFAERHRRLLLNGEHQFDERASVEGGHAGEHLVENDAERPQVGPRVDVLRRTHLFRGHIARGPHDRLARRERRFELFRELGNAKVEQFHKRRAVGGLAEEQV